MHESMGLSGRVNETEIKPTMRNRKFVILATTLEPKNHVDSRLRLNAIIREYASILEFFTSKYQSLTLCWCSILFPN